LGIVMMRQIAWRAVAALCIVCGVLILPTHGSHATSAKPSVVSQALAFMPATATEASFTDWALIKQYKSATTLTSASPLRAKQTFLNSLEKDQATTTGFGLEFYRLMRGLWSFDSLDLQWEAEGDTSSTPISVLRFNDSFNFAPVLAHFAQRGYAKTIYHGIALYSHPMALTQSWFTQGPLGVLNAAYLPESHILVFSSAPVSVRAALDAYLGRSPSMVRDEAITTTAGALGVAAAAIFEPEHGACSSLAVDDSAATGNEPGNLSTLRKQVHHYDAFAIGYRDQGGRPLGIAGLHFADPADAAADRQIRRGLAITGTSVRVGLPYSKSVFTLIGTSVTGGDLVFHLRPFQNQPRRLFDMVIERDVLFALCPQ
jgi:hypothetical protein